MRNKLQVAKRNPGLVLGREAQARPVVAARVCCCPGCIITGSPPAVQGRKPDGQHTCSKWGWPSTLLLLHRPAPGSSWTCSCPHLIVPSQPWWNAFLHLISNPPNLALTPWGEKSQLLITAPIFSPFAKLIGSQGQNVVTVKETCTAL